MNKIYFCKNKCCPFIKINENTVELGDPNGPEGVTEWSKKQFTDFINSVKNGDFDNI